MMKKELELVQDWDKTFAKSDKVNHRKVTFHNRYGITLAADLYEPKNYAGKLPAIAVCGPFGAVKEQCSGLYAQTMAEMGFLTIAFDHPLRVKAADSQDIQPHRILTRRIFRLLLIFCRFRTMLILKKSVSSVYAAGAEWRLMLLHLIQG